MSDTTIISAQLGFFVLEPFTDESNQYSGFHKYPVVAWKVLDCESNFSGWSIATPVVLACELDDHDLSHMAVEMPNGQVHLVKNGQEQFFATAQEWFSSLKCEVF